MHYMLYMLFTFGHRITSPNELSYISQLACMNSMYDQHSIILFHLKEAKILLKSGYAVKFNAIHVALKMFMGEHTQPNRGTKQGLKMQEKWFSPATCLCKLYVVNITRHGMKYIYGGIQQNVFLCLSKNSCGCLPSNFCRISRKTCVFHD